MGNKILRPSELEPFAGFNDDQLSYLKDKFEILSDQNNLLSAQKISQELQTSRGEAGKILNSIDFEGHEEVDYYQFVCAAASLHQNDDQARQFIFDIYAAGKQLDQNGFQLFFGTVFRYLKFLDLIPDVFTQQIGLQKFKKYDFNQNGAISFDEFESMLQNDYHCRMWMQTLGFCKEQPKQIVEKPVNQQIPSDFSLQQEKGDQFGASPAWYKVAEQMAPLDKSLKSQNKSPAVDLQIGYVYGYRSYDTRDNLRYATNGDIIYHTAACGIVLNKTKNTMRVNTSHNDDITCLDVNNSKGIVATGQMGRRPALIIWDSATMESKNVFVGKLEKSISNVAISKSGRFVAATSMSDNHEIAVYDISKNCLVAYGQGPKSVIFSIKFNRNEEEVICACDKEVVFVRFSSGKIESKKGVFGKVPLNPTLCVAVVGEDVITSMSNGLLVQWKGNFTQRVYKEHSKSVGALCERSQGGLISGDSQGNIILWSNNMSKQRQISLQKLLAPIKSNSIRIIALCEQQNQILVGTRGGQIIQIAKNNAANIIIEGHYDKELWGLSVSGNKNEFYTGGQDKLLIKWNMLKRKPQIKKKLEYPIVSLDLSRGNVLAVGQRNGIINFHDGTSLNYLKKITAHKNPDKDVVSVVKFSPDGEKIAIGYCPPVSKVYLYEVGNLHKIGECKGSATRIWSVDFSMGGDAMLNTSDQPLFYKTSNCSQITAVSSLKGQQWATMSSRFTWFTRGIWPPCSDGSDVNSVDRSNSKKYLASGDDFSKVKVFRYPVCTPRQMYNEYKGHSSHVTGVRWSFDDKFCISIGGLEKSIIQWNVNEGIEGNIIDEDEPQVQEKKEDEVMQEVEYEQDEGDQALPQEGEFGLQVDEGDQALAVKPFLGQVKASTPLNYKVSHKNVEPEENLVINHVWGVRNLYINDRVRNQVRYSASASSCYFITAALGVQMDLKSKKQTFYQGQAQDLISFAITKDRKVCATGQMAQLNLKNPKDKIVDVHVWDAQSKKQLVKLVKFHQRAIVILQFSPSGKKLLTIGQDDKNSLAVYDWEVNRIAWSSPVDGAKVTGAAWRNQTEYATVGLKHIKFWSQGKGSQGKIAGKWDPMLSVIHWNDKFVSGGASGNVYLWGGSTGNPSKGHEGTVDCLAVDQSGNLLSGCSKGTIILWKFSGGKLVSDKKLFQMSKFDNLDPGVLSMDFTKDNMLVCTNSSSIYEISLKDKKEPLTVMESHFKGQLWAEAWSPDCNRFVTGGDDKTIRIFDAKSTQQLHVYKMKERVRGIDWEQSEGELIIVGEYTGRIYLFDTELNLLSEVRSKFNLTKPKQEPYWIQDIKFSPNGQYIAFGAHGGPSHVQIYEIADKKIVANSRKIIKSLFSSALLSIDWSQGSDLLMGVSQAYELQFMSLTSKVSASSTRDVKWATWSAKFGFYVQQIFQKVEYSSINAVTMSPSKTLVVTGSDDQKIRLFTSPVTIPKQKCKQFIGHSSHITKVRFSKNQKYLLSEGGNDRTIILWNMEGTQEEEPEQVQEKEEEEKFEEYEGMEDAEDIEVPHAREEKAKPKPEPKESDDFQMEQDEGDQFMAVKPWLGAIKEPTKPYYKGAGKAPRVDFELQYAHGYRTKDCRNNLIYLSPEKIAYHTAGLGVIMEIDKSPREQTFFSEHTDDIISFAWNNQKTEIFTGQMGAKPILYRWDAKGNMLKSYRGAKKGVSALAVNSKYLVGAGLDDDHYLYVFDKDKGGLLASQKGGRDVIIGMKWVSENSFVSVGIKHYRLWDLNGKVLKGKTGVFGKNCNLLCCVEVKDQKIFCGASNGQLQIWGGTSCTKSIKAHTGAINAICIHSDILLTGSNDKTISLINASSLQIINTINCSKLITHSMSLSIRAIDAIDNKILIGTYGSQIYELKSNEAIQNASSAGQFKLMGNYMNGHFAPNFVTNELWGLSLYIDNSYVTCSDDGTLRGWDLSKRQQTFCIDLKFDDKLKPLKLNPKDKNLPDSVKGRCLAVSKQGFLVIGCKDGTVRIIDQNLKPLSCKQISKKQISHIKFSPDQTMVAIGSHDCKIYLFNWQEQGTLKLKSQSIHHNSYIKHFDFSRDGNYLHSTCGAYELLFWDTNTGKQITSGATLTRDEEWATWNVTLGWPVQGIWEAFMDGTDINAIDRSSNVYGGKMKLIATGDDRGKVRLLEYPCLVKNSEAVYGKGHSSHVTNVLFSREDINVLSTGGQDQTILQWTLSAE